VKSYNLESKIVTVLAGVSVLLAILASIYFYIKLTASPPRPPYIFLYLSFVILIEICWSFFTLIRRTIYFSRTKGGPGGLKALLKPVTPEASASRAFALLYALPLLTVLTVFLRDSGLVPVHVGNFILTMGISSFYVVFTVVHLNHSAESGSFMVKWIGASLMLVLTFLGAVGYLVFPFWDKTYSYQHPFTEGQSLRFSPQNNSKGYEAKLVPGGFDKFFINGPKMPISRQTSHKIDLQFKFPFAGEQWKQLYIHQNGIVSFGSPVSNQAIWVKQQKAIAPMWMSTRLDNESGIFHQSFPGQITITWANILEGHTKNRRSLQLTLFKDGTIDFNYLNIDGCRPTIIGIFSGKGFSDVKEIKFDSDLPLNTGFSTIIENSYKDYRTYIHRRMLPLGLVILLATLVIVIIFPIIFRINLLKPMDLLLTGLKQVKKGDLNISLPIRVKDEIGFLTDSFNHMVLSLKEAKDGWLKANQIKDKLLALNHAILDTAGEGFLTLNNHGTIISINKAAEEMFLYNREEIIGKPGYILLDEENKQQGMGFVEYYQASGQKKRFGVDHELKGRRKDGDLFPLEFAVSMAEPEEGRIFTVVLHDLSDHQRLATEKMQLEEQLHQSQKLETIGTLAGGVAHDFNNILTPIIGYAEMALDDLQANNETRKYLENILKSCSRARDLVKQILTFSRKNPTVFELVDMAYMIKNALQLLRASTPSTINFQLNIDSKNCTVFGDRTQLEQVLINLCTNATHAMMPGGGTLYVDLQTVTVDETLVKGNPALIEEKYVMLRVRDTGKGMDKETFSHIFEPFFTTKPVGQGTGLGLSVVHGIIDKHGGAILVDSEVDKGSTFSAYFPLIPLKEVEKEVHEEEIKKGNESILLVDDEEIIANMYKESLKRVGYRVTALTSSLETLEVYRSRPEDFDLIISDNTMPFLTGIQMAEEIKKINPDIPIIVCTGNSDMVSVENANHLDIDRILAKPVYFRTLNRAIRELLDHVT
jgi:PAS domain S-box-containing protein